MLQWGTRTIGKSKKGGREDTGRECICADMKTRWEGECLRVRRRARMYQEKRGDQRCKEMTHWGNVIQQKNQNRVIINQAVLQRRAIIHAPISAAAVLLSIWSEHSQQTQDALSSVLRYYVQQWDINRMIHSHCIELLKSWRMCNTHMEFKLKCILSL